MIAKLISYSKPSEFQTYADDVMPPLGCEDLIAYCARVSNPSGQNNTATNEKLLNYLIKNKHWSPFEMASACIEINTTRDIARQILRHRSFSFQEFSQRYADPLKELRPIWINYRTDMPNCLMVIREYKSLLEQLKVKNDSKTNIL